MRPYLLIVEMRPDLFVVTFCVIKKELFWDKIIPNKPQKNHQN